MDRNIRKLYFWLVGLSLGGILGFFLPFILEKHEVIYYIEGWHFLVGMLGCGLVLGLIGLLIGSIGMRVPDEIPVPPEDEEGDS